LESGVIEINDQGNASEVLAWKKKEKENCRPRRLI